MELEKLKAFVEKHEGRRHKRYFDTANPPRATIGVGFNLDRPGAKGRIAALGVNYAKLRAAEVELTDSQIDLLFAKDLQVAIDNARKAVANFDELPTDKQIVVVDMVFNLGLTGFKAFKKLINALKEEDWERAASEMTDSDWYGQVGNRSVEDVQIMRKA